MLASVTPRQLLVASLVIWCACIGLALGMATPLTSDEASYALLARGAGDSWLYRPLGFVAFARIGAALGDSETALRLPSAILACGLIIAVGAVGRRLSPWHGAWAAAVIAGTHTFVLRAPALLNDVPAAICILVAMVIVIDELERPRGASYRLILVAPVLAAVFYLRYGTAPTIAIVVLAACALWWRAIVLRPGPVIATALVFSALLVPFFVYSKCTTGSFTAILTLAGEVAGRRYIGHGLVIYVISNPFTYHGALVAPLVVIGLASIARPPQTHRRRARFFAIVAVGQILSIGLISHASARFIFVAIVLLVILGVDAIARAIDAHPRWSPGAIRIAAVAVVVAWIGMLIAIVPMHRKIHRGLAELVASGRAIRADAAGRPCAVIARSTPQLMWYSRCAAVKPPQDYSELGPVPADHRLYTATVPRRGADPERVGELLSAQPVPIAPGAWYLRPTR